MIPITIAAMSSPSMSSPSLAWRTWRSYPDRRSRQPRQRALTKRRSPDIGVGRSAVVAAGLGLGLDELEVLVEQDGQLLARRVDVDLVGGAGVLRRVLGARRVDRGAGDRGLGRGCRLGEGVAGERLLVRVAAARSVM